MILQRRSGEHIHYACELIAKGYPVFIDKPVCNTKEEMETRKALAKAHDTVICGGSGLKHNRQIKELKKMIGEGRFGQIRGGTINHSADIDSPYIKTGAEVVVI